MSVKVPNTRNICREGINTAQTFFERNDCVFQEVAQQNDFGKDAYIDIVQDGIVTCLCAAVQIKSGDSFRNPQGDYFVPVDKHADSWRRSTVPVFGIVYDPADSLLRWVDLTGYLRAHPQQEAGSVPIPRKGVLNESSLRGEFSRAVSIYAGGSAIALNLLSEEETQTDAVFDAWALGRHDARYLILLRRVILELRPYAVRRAIVALSHAASHPDILLTKDNWIPPAIEEQVLPSFRWSPDEIAHMIRAIEEEAWGRGTIGQSFDVLMYEDPKVVGKLHAAVGILLSTVEDMSAVRTATLALSHSRDARRELSLLVRDYPALMANEWFRDIAATVQEFGHFSLY